MILAALAFICAYISITLGMGFGIIVTPVLLLVGFHPLEIVPAVLIAEFLSGSAAAAFHQKLKNVNFMFGSRACKIVTIMCACSIIGVVVAVFIATSIPRRNLEVSIATIIVCVGIITIVMRGKSLRFSWINIALFGIVGSFNKALSGGGYGPLVTGGQILSGVPGKEAVAVTSLTKAITCLVGILAYKIAAGTLDLSLALPLVLGSLLSVPFATLLVKRMSQEKIKFLVGFVTIVLGVLMLAKLFV
jgi:uncharacterized membrane protein YfcA